MIPLRFLSAALLVLIALSFGLPATAQTAVQDPAKAEKLRQLMEVTKMDANYAGMVNNMTAQMGGELAKRWPDPAKQQKARAIIQEEMGGMAKELLATVNKLMADSYTVAELDQIIAFYRSPIGQKSVQVTIQVSQQIVPMMATQVATYGSRIQKRLETEVK